MCHKHTQRTAGTQKLPHIKRTQTSVNMWATSAGRGGICAPSLAPVGTSKTVSLEQHVEINKTKTKKGVLNRVAV